MKIEDLQFLVETVVRDVPGAIVECNHRGQTPVKVAVALNFPETIVFALLHRCPQGLFPKMSWFGG